MILLIIRNFGENFRFSYKKYKSLLLSSEKWRRQSPTVFSITTDRNHLSSISTSNNSIVENPLSVNQSTKTAFGWAVRRHPELCSGDSKPLSLVHCILAARQNVQQCSDLDDSRSNSKGWIWDIASCIHKESLWIRLLVCMNPILPKTKTKQLFEPPSRYINSQWNDPIQTLASLRVPSTPPNPKSANSSNSTTEYGPEMNSSAHIDTAYWCMDLLPPHTTGDNKWTHYWKLMTW